MPRGEKNKLSNDDKLRITQLKGKKSGYKVAKQFNVSHTAIYKIWKKNDRNQNSKNMNIDTKILQKLLPFIVEANLKPWGFTRKEKNRLKELYRNYEKSKLELISFKQPLKKINMKEVEKNKNLREMMSKLEKIKTETTVNFLEDF